MAEHERRHVPATVEIRGTDGRMHTIPTDQTPKFFHGSDGAPLTDAEWDEMKRREVNPPTFDYDQFKVVSS